MDLSNMATVRKKVDQMKKELSTLRKDAENAETTLSEKKRNLKNVCSQLVKKTQKLAEMEDEMDTTKLTLQKLSDQLVIAEKKLDADAQSCMLLEGRKIINEEYTRRLERELAELSTRSNEFMKKTLIQLTENIQQDIDVEAQEERTKRFEERTVELDQKLNEIASERRVLEASGIQAEGRHVIKEEQIVSVITDTDEIKQSAVRCEYETVEAIKLMERKEVELASAREEYHRTKQEVDFLVLDICNK